MPVIGNLIGGITEYLRRMDKWLLFFCLSLSGMSVFFLYKIAEVGVTTDASRAKTQLSATLLGLAAAIVISLLDYNTLLKLWKLYMPICIIMVVLTFFMGVERGSNKAWLYIPIMGRTVSLQPSELLKISFITTFALHINEVGKELNTLKNVILLAIHGGVHVLLILIQKDSGTAIVFAGIFIIMIISAGLSWKYILAGAAIIAAALPLVWSKFMSIDQQLRFMVLMDPTINKDYAYQQAQGLKALGVGGITGVGFSNRVVYVPESYNDFIFTFIGQTTGIIGCTLVIIILVALCIRLVYNANRATDNSGRIICIGFMAMLAVQSIMNIGMCINVLPVIGVPLPFLSSGGSSVLALYLGVGLCLSVYRFKKKDLFE